MSIKWYLRDEQLMEDADQFQATVGGGPTLLMAPHISRHEVANALASACRSNRVTWEVAMSGYDSYLSTGISIDSDPDWLIKRAARHTVDLAIPIHDAVYVALADMLGISFVTADRKLHDAIRSKLPFAHYLGDL